MKPCFFCPSPLCWKQGAASSLAASDDEPCRLGHAPRSGVLTAIRKPDCAAAAQNPEKAPGRAFQARLTRALFARHYLFGPPLLVASGDNSDDRLPKRTRGRGLLSAPSSRNAAVDATHLQLSRKNSGSPPFS